MRPSERFVIPTSDAFAPPLTLGLPLAINGGQNDAHCPVHELFGARSFANRYSVRPRESTRTCPRLVFVVEMTGAGFPAACANDGWKSARGREQSDGCCCSDEPRARHGGGRTGPVVRSHRVLRSWWIL
jgi:hypothetical protein